MLKNEIDSLVRFHRWSLKTALLLRIRKISSKKKEERENVKANVKSKSSEKW